MKINGNVMSTLRNGQLKKYFLIMRLTCLLILLLSLTTSASVWSQKMSVKMSNSTLQELFQQIEKSSHYRFFYNNDDVNVNQRISVDAEDETVGNILASALNDLPYSFKELENKLILIEKMDKKSNTYLPVGQQQRSVSGTIKDPSGATLPGVSVVIQGTTNGTISDSEGKYTLPNVPENAVLIFSFVGMKRQVILVGSQTTVDVVLTEETVGIEEVVAVGYGTQKKANLTGSVASIHGNELVKVVSTSTSQTLQGRMSGVQISQNSGAPGSGSTIKIRGTGSLKSNNSPLVVVDGFIGSLDDISAGDIESISVLKDAASSAIYGSRAANGVILVTTKRGKSGKMIVNVNADYGMQSLTTKPEFLNASEYATKQNEERLYGKQQPYWTGDLAPEKLGIGTDWYGYVYDHTTPIQNYYIGLSGGTEATKYAVSLGYIDQEGIAIGSNYDRTNLRTNFDHQFNKKIHLGINLDLKRDNSYNETGGGETLAQSITTTGPTVPVFFPDGSDGIFLPSRPGEKTMDGKLTPNLIRGSNCITNQSFIARTSIFLEIEILKGLSFKSVFNKAISNSTSKNWTPTYAFYSPENASSPLISNSTASLTNTSTSGDAWEIQELLSYKYSYKSHTLALLAGFSSEQSKSSRMYGTKTSFPSNDLQVLNAGSVINSLGGTTNDETLTSLFGQVNYDYKGKYLFQANIRRDGSSVFAPENQFGTFPSASAAWRLSEEPIVKSIEQISNLKLRCGYGTLGNAGIPQYAWISTYQITDAHPFGSNVQTWNPAYYITNMSNPDIKWESTTSFDLGLDLGLFANRFNLTADYYQKDTHDLLLDATVTGSSGYINGPVVNLGKVQNKGWELSASWDDQIRDINYGVSFNLSHNDNMVVDMGGIKPQIMGGKIVKEGLPINSFWGYKTDGIFKTWDEVNKYPHFTGDFRPGEYKVVDVSGPAGVPDGKITADDKVFLGERNPKYYYGATLSAEWKGFDISLLLTGEALKKAMYENIYGTGPATGYGQTTKYWYENRAILDAAGNVVSGTTPVAGTKFNDWNYFSDGNMYDVSFFRIKNIQAGYKLPERWLKQIKIVNARIYLNAVNPFLFTKYMGADPETTQDVNNASFGSSGRGAYQYYPVCKSYSIGLSLKF